MTPIDDAFFFRCEPLVRVGACSIGTLPIVEISITCCFRGEKVGTLPHLPESTGFSS